MMFSTIVVLGLLACTQAVPFLSSRSAYHVSEAANEWSWDLYKQIAAQQAGNVLVSPWSAHNMFALAYMGAEGYTAKEMASVLRFEHNKEKVASGFRDIYHHWNSTRNSSVIFNSVNQLYPAEGIPVKSTYEQAAREAFNATVEPINFADGHEAAEKINRYVEQNTDGHIKEVVSPTSLNSLSRLVFVNALYFKGLWSKPFTTLPEQLTFYHQQSNAKKVPAMRLQAELPFGYSEEMNAQVVQLPYNDTTYSLVVIVPRGNESARNYEGFRHVEEKLPVHLPQMLSQLHHIKVDIRMPKFKFTQKVDLTQVMQKLGMRHAFTHEANFKAISDEKLYISQATQKTYIEVNEEGTTAAGASAIEIETTSAPIEVAVDRPFLFVLWNTVVGAPLMMGRVSEPWNYQN